MTSDSETQIGDDIALQAALEREAATREILQVISESRDDEQPVFDVILRNAARLCGSPMARLELADDTRTTFQCVAAWGEEMRSFRLGDAMPLDLPNDLPTAIREGVIRHIHDLSKSELYLQGDPFRVRMVEEEGYRTYLIVPLLVGVIGIGAIVLCRREVAPFADEEIALVESFAAQAVIAIDNVRQFRELQTRLEREAATRQILEVISQSRADEKPVFDAILENAARLCDSPMASLNLLDEKGARLVLRAHWGEALDHFEEGVMEWPLDGSSAPVVAVRECRIAHIEDLADTEAYRRDDPIRVRSVDQEGIRTFLAVPLMRGGAAIGSIALFRREVRPFDDRHIDLVETFAAQAVIAIENVRQFRELQTRLEREAATREILQVISQSRDDEIPVFRAILDRAERICGAEGSSMQLLNETGTHLRMMVLLGEDEGSFPPGTEFDLNGPAGMCVAVREGRVVHIEDLKDTELYKQGHEGRRKLVDVEGRRTHLNVPLKRGGTAFGNITLGRNEVKPFTPDQIALVETFAEQAVIAIENVRQFRELQARLEREAATRQILEVISQSRADEKPVFDAILENAARLCNAPLAYMSMANEERTHVTVPAHRGSRPKFAADLDDLHVPIEGSKLALVRAITECNVIRMDDIADDELYRNREPNRVSMVEIEGARSILVVPLISGGQGVGAIILYRREVAPFSDDDVALAESFAAQAVIAVENVKQFKALQARTEEVQALNENLESRVATQVDELERMGRLKRFLSPQVADAVLSSGDDKLLSSHRALIATLFCDMRGFTAFCETAEPEEAIEVLQAYHKEMGTLIGDYGAGVDHRSGDGIMVIFNDPLPCDSPAEDAVKLALAMREKMAALCADWRKLGHRLGFGVGISLGYATVGVVGSAGRYDYTASGTAVNLAARLSDQASDGEILLSPRAHKAVEDAVVVETAGELTLKGIQAPVEVVRVIRLKDAEVPTDAA